MAILDLDDITPDAHQFFDKVLVIIRSDCIDVWSYELGSNFENDIKSVLSEEFFKYDINESLELQLRATILRHLPWCVNNDIFISRHPKDGDIYGGIFQGDPFYIVRIDLNETSCIDIYIYPDKDYMKITNVFFGYPAEEFYSSSISEL